MSRLQFIYRLIQPYRGRLLTACLLTALFTVGSLMPPLAMRFLLNRVATPQQWNLLPLTIGLIIFLPIWNGIIAGINRIFIGAIGQRLVVDLRTGFYRHVVELSMRFHGSKGPGFVMSRLMTDIGMVQNLLTGETLGMLASVIALIFSLVMAFFLNWKLSPILLGMILLYVLNYRLCSLRIRRANLELRDIMDQVTGRLQERIAGVRLVKTYCRERDETGHFLASTNRALEQSFRGDMLTVYMNIGARLISGIGATCIFGGACWYVLRHQMGYGDVTALMTYVWQAINPAVSLTMLAGTITQALVSLDRVIEIFQWQPEVTERPDAVELDTAHGDITLDNVFFSYKEDKPLFQGFTYHIAAGKMTALVGHTGCGKTTITSLIMRLWDVQDGRVTLDGHDVRDLTLRSLRKHIGVVPQEPVVFEGTAFDNIAYALPDATPAQVEEAARAAQIHDFISALPDGYHTWFGKEGAKLSVGEKQRIAIARAMLRKPAVLILDEATSSLDSESEAALQEALHVVLHGRTSVVVAHRLSTIVQADQIVAMDNGRIIEVGTHDALMRVDGGYYRKLYEELKGMHTVEEAAG